MTLKNEVLWIKCYENFKPPAVETQVKNYSDASIYRLRLETEF